MGGRCTITRPLALALTGEAHDLFRFVDFRATSVFPPTPAQEERWATWTQRYHGLTHEETAAAFLRTKGYAALADIVAVHGLRLPSSKRATVEQQILFYTDKRVQEQRIVSLRDRFEDFRRRYGEGDRAASKEWFDEAKRLEKELFPRGVPV